MTLSEAVSRFGAARVLTMLIAVVKARTVSEPAVADLRPEDVSAVVDEILALGAAHGLTHTTRRSIATLKRFGAWLHRRGLALVDPARRLVLPKVPRRLGFVPSPSEVERLLVAATPERALERSELRKPQTLRLRRRAREARARRRDREHAEALRDVALLELLYGSGLRMKEAIALRLSDVDLQERTAFVRKGKGGKDRVVPLTKEAVKALQVYLAEARGVLQGTSRVRRRRLPTTSLLLSTVGGPLDAQTWRERRLATMLHAAHLPPNLTPHRLRHACAVHLLEAGAGVVHLARLLGHERLETTAIYLQLTTKALERAILDAHPREREPR